MYCEPESVIVIVSIGPRAIADAVAPEPPPPVIVTVGTEVYPEPPSITVMPVTEPFVICAVADA